MESEQFNVEDSSLARKAIKHTKYTKTFPERGGKKEEERRTEAEEKRAEKEREKKQMDE